MINGVVMRIATLFVVGILASGPALIADSHGAELLGGSFGVKVAFTDHEIRVIRAHYETDRGSKSRGKSRNSQKSLPPGIRKNLARGKPLPPGIAKQTLPYELREALPPARDGHERIIVDGKVLLVEIATQVVRDVLSDVILN